MNKYYFLTKQGQELSRETNLQLVKKISKFKNITQPLHNMKVAYTSFHEKFASS